MPHHHRTLVAYVPSPAFELPRRLRFCVRVPVDTMAEPSLGEPQFAAHAVTEPIVRRLD